MLRCRQSPVLDSVEDSGILPAARHTILPVRPFTHVLERQARRDEGRPHRLRLQYHVCERGRCAHGLRDEPRRGARARGRPHAWRQAERGEQGDAQGAEAPSRELRVPRQRADGGARPMVRGAPYAVQAQAGGRRADQRARRTEKARKGDIRRRAFAFEPRSG